MRKITFFMKGVSLAFLGLMMAQCNGNKANEESAPSNKPSNSTTNLRLAYVDVDSLLSQYQYSKDLNESIVKKEENIRATLNQKGKILQKEAAEFQRKVQNNAFLSQDRARQENDRMVKMQQELQSLQERLSAELQSEGQKNTNQMRDSVRSFLAQYNKKHKYSMILSNSGFDNLLYADSALNITADVVKGLNARYKKAEK